MKKDFNKLLFIFLQSLPIANLFQICIVNLQYFYSMKKNQSSVSNLANSWVHKCGISKQNNGASVFGLNPNLNIEDEYVQNLLKQIHFMNMEVKLLKQKQQQSEGNSLWGIINRSNEPLVKNIVDSNEKYQGMKKQVDGDLNKTQYDNIKLADQQNAIIKKMNNLEKRIVKLQTEKAELANNAKERKDKINEKIVELQNKLKHQSAEREEQTKKNTDLLNQFECLTFEIEKQKFTSSYERSKIKNDEDIEAKILEERLKEIQNIKNKMVLLKQSIENSQEFQRAKHDQQLIKEKMDKAEKGIAESDFQLIKIIETIKLAQKEKEKQILQRKRLMENYQASKVILKQIQALNATRLDQQVALRKRESLDIQKGEAQTKKLEKNLEEIKKKLTRSQESEKALKQEVEHMERQLAKLKEKSQGLNQTLKKLVESNGSQEMMLDNCKNEYRKVQDQFEKVVNSELTSSIQLNDIENEIVYLRQRKDYLSEVLNLKDTLNQTKLEDLQKVVQKNKDVNQTVGLLMEKWQQIKSFSKM